MILKRFDLVDDTFIKGRIGGEVKKSDSFETDVRFWRDLEFREGVEESGETDDKRTGFPKVEEKS